MGWIWDTDMRYQLNMDWIWDMGYGIWIGYLMRGSGGNKDGVAETLNDIVSPDSVLGVEPLAEGSVQIPALVVNGIVMRFQPLPALQRHFIQKVPDGIRVPRLVDVPQRSRHLPVFQHSRPRRVVAIRLINRLQGFYNSIIQSFNSIIQ